MMTFAPTASEIPAKAGIHDTHTRLVMLEPRFRGDFERGAGYGLTSAGDRRDAPSPGMLSHSALSREGRGLNGGLLVARLPSPLAGEGGAQRRVRGRLGILHSPQIALFHQYKEHRQ
jgi:hypothetical protein